LPREQRSKRRKSLGELSAPTPLSDEQRAAAEAKMCGEKRRFKLRGEAERLAQEYGLGVYRCQICGGWHFTSKQP
jgi:hypothetical protein